MFARTHTDSRNVWIVGDVSAFFLSRKGLKRRRLAFLPRMLIPNLASCPNGVAKSCSREHCSNGTTGGKYSRRWYKPRKRSCLQLPVDWYAAGYTADSVDLIVGRLDNLESCSDANAPRNAHSAGGQFSQLFFVIDTLWIFRSHCDSVAEKDKRKKKVFKLGIPLDRVSHTVFLQECRLSTDEVYQEQPA